MSQVLKLGYERYRKVCVWQGKGDRLGNTSVHAQVSQHDSTGHVQRFFLAKVQKQMIVTSFDDITDILLIYIGGRNKRECMYKTKGLVLVLVCIGLWEVQFSSGLFFG